MPNPAPKLKPRYACRLPFAGERRTRASVTSRQMAAPSAVGVADELAALPTLGPERSVVEAARPGSGRCTKHTETVTQ